MQPYYEQDEITIYHGDARDVLPSLSLVDLVLTDPPYNAINRVTGGLRSLDKGGADALPVDITAIAGEIIRLTTGSAYVWCSDEQYTDWCMAFKRAGMTTRKCAWWKSNPSPMNGEHLWLSALELCVFSRKAGAHFGLHCQPPIWQGPTERDVDHPTPKPEWLMRLLIQASTKPDDLVLDPFMGSGTTLRAAKDLGRRAIGIELEEKYVQIAIKRLQQSVMALEVAS